jgi:6-pyruvoyltetrahydropterin/6-carboxytetrahydropterin synthase
MKYESTKIIELGSCAFRQWRAESHCRFIHGYRLVAKFWFECERLDERNWVVDFGGLKGLKNILESQFDHTLCVAFDDPHMREFKNLHDKGVVDLRVMQNGVGIEKTAEWCLIESDKFIREITNNRCWVKKVEVWEHEKNSAIVSHSHRTVATHNPYVSDKHVAEQYELNFTTSGNSCTTAVAAPSPEVQASLNTDAAPLNNKVTTGWSNPFGGTSWGV